MGKRQFRELKCILCESTNMFYKCGKYEEMTGTERMKLMTKEMLCFNYLKKNHNADKCSSKNKCICTGWTELHHTSFHNYFKKKVDDTNEENTKVCICKTAKRQAVFLQIMPVKARSKGGCLYQHMHWWIVEGNLP